MKSILRALAAGTFLAVVATFFPIAPAAVFGNSATCSNVSLDRELKTVWKPGATGLVTASPTEYDNAISRYGYTDARGASARTTKTATAGMVEVRRLWNGTTNDFRWSLPPGVSSLLAAGYVDQGVDFYAFANPGAGCETARLYRKGAFSRLAIRSADHVALINDGWSGFGDVFYLPPASADSGLVDGRFIWQGDLNLRVPGQTVTGVDVRGAVQINAENVTVDRSRVRGGTNGPPDRYRPLVDAYAGKPGAVIKNTHIQEATPSEWNSAGIGGYNFTADGVTVIGQVDSIYIIGDNVTVRNSILKDNVRYQPHWQSQPSPPDEPTHNDNIQILLGNNILIENNILTGSKSLGIVAAPERGPTGVTIRGNFVDDGACSIKVSSKSNRNYRYQFTIRDNVLGGHQTSWNCHIVRGGRTAMEGLTLSNNKVGNGGVPTSVSSIRNFATGTDAKVLDWPE